MEVKNILENLEELNQEDRTFEGEHNYIELNPTPEGETMLEIELYENEGKTEDL